MNYILRTAKGTYKTIERSKRVKGFHVLKLGELDSPTYWVSDQRILVQIPIEFEERHKTDSYFIDKVNKMMKG